MTPLATSAVAVVGVTLLLALPARSVAASQIETLTGGSSVSGSASAWGNNGYGSLGNGSTTNSLTPVAVSLPSGTTVAAVAGGGDHSLALTSTGQMLAWGDNLSGQLGNGTSTNSSTPVAVSLPTGTTITAIAAGQYHSLALTSTGQVLAWGFNFSGQLGNGTTINSSTPIAVSLPSGTTVTAIAGGSSHSLALTSTGQLLAWGYNPYGQLGNGATTNSSAPVQVSLPPGTMITAVAAGGNHSLALTSSGQVLAWGWNGAGQLGDGTTTNSSTPVQVSLPSGTIVTAIAGGIYHSLALTSSGKVLAWGDNTWGELGNGSTTNSSTPVQVSLPSWANVAAIAGGGNDGLALTSSGQVLGWGLNNAGQLGNGTTINSSTPVQVSLPSLTTVTAIAVGGGHCLAILLWLTVFPAVTNGAYGGYVTTVTIQNTGPAPASVRIVYFDQNGAPVGAGDAIGSLPVHASWTVRQDNGNSFPSSGGNAAQAGSAVVYSSQPVAAFVNELAPGNAGDPTAYSGVQVPAGSGATLYAPTIVNNAYGGYTTGIGLDNLSASAVNITVTYRDTSGTVAKTQTLNNVAGKAYQGLYSGDVALGLPVGFAGTATITSSGGNLAAVVNETGPGGQFSSYDAVPAGSTTLYAPVALNNAYGGYNTGMGIQNTTGTAGMVTIDYYNPSGSATTTTAPIAANGYLGVYQGTDIASTGAYTARITSTVAIAAIVNEVAPSSTTAKQSTAYNTFGAGSGTLHLPLVESAGSDGWSTGEGIMNTGSSATTVTVTYYDPVTGLQVGATDSQLLQPNAFWGLYQPAGGLPTGARASAVITTTGQPVAVICNESNTTSFMSYAGS